MRKNELIKLLEAIPGNDEVVIWNGMVGDWNPISKNIEKIELVKESREFLENAINSENAREGLPPIGTEDLDKIVREREWDLPNQFVGPDMFGEWYEKTRKRLIVLDIKLRGKSTWDRHGTISY